MHTRVLVRSRGKVVFQKGYGVRDLRTFAKFDQRTNVRLASFTKQFTAMAIMLLVEDGNHVGMAECRGQAGLAHRPSEIRVAVGPGRPADPLDRHGPVQDPVAGKPHRAHSAPPDLTLELVPACDDQSVLRTTPERS